MPQTMPNSITRDIINGVVISTLIFLVSGWIPVFGLLGLLSLPLPIFYYRAKLGRRNGLIMLAAVLAVIMAVVGGFSPDIMFVTGMLMTGFVLCELVEKGLGIEQTVLFTGLAVFSAGALGLILYSNMAGIQLGSLLSAYVKKNLVLSLQLYEEIGMPAERIQLISQSLDIIQYYMLRILPALCGAFLLVVTWITFLGARLMLIKKGVGFPDFGKLNNWQAPEVLVWGVIGGGGLLMLPADPARLIGLNVLILLLTVYFFHGIAIISFYLEKKQLPMVLRFLIYSMIAMWNLLLIFVVGLGFFDMWADFRRLKKPETPDGDPEE